MISIKIEFDYEEQHYELKAALKRDIKEHTVVLTGHQCNDDLDLTYYGDQYHIVKWEGDLPTIEVVIEANHHGVKIHNVILLGKTIDDVEQAMSGEFENEERRIRGKF